MGYVIKLVKWRKMDEEERFYLAESLGVDIEDLDDTLSRLESFDREQEQLDEMAALFGDDEAREGFYD